MMVKLCRTPPARKNIHGRRVEIHVRTPKVVYTGHGTVTRIPRLTGRVADLTLSLKAFDRVPFLERCLAATQVGSVSPFCVHFWQFQL